MDTKSKAWFVFLPEEWGELVHAETAGKAKVKILGEFGGDFDYTELRATRVKGFDGIPITFQNCDVANWHYVDEDGNPLKEDEFFNICGCKICSEGGDNERKTTVLSAHETV